VLVAAALSLGCGRVVVVADGGSEGDATGTSAGDGGHTTVPTDDGTTTGSGGVTGGGGTTTTSTAGTSGTATSHTATTGATTTSTGGATSTTTTGVTETTSTTPGTSTSTTTTSALDCPPEPVASPCLTDACVQVEPVWSKCRAWYAEEVRADGGLLVHATDHRVLKIGADGTEVEIHDGAATGVSEELIVQGRGFALIDHPWQAFFDIHDDTGAFVVRHEIPSDPQAFPPPCWYRFLPEVGWAVYVEGVGGEPCEPSYFRLLAPDASEVLLLSAVDPGWFEPLIPNELGLYGATPYWGPDEQTMVLLGLDGVEQWRFDTEDRMRDASAAWASDDLALATTDARAFHLRDGMPIATLTFPPDAALRARMAVGGRYMVVLSYNATDYDDIWETVVLEDGIELWRADPGDDMWLRDVSDQGETLLETGVHPDERVVLLDRQGSLAWDQPAPVNVYSAKWFPGGDTFLTVGFELHLRRYTVWRIVR
jgi:hypothetical protein